ncbi:MAG: hypothetical protein P1U63_01675 [Coxiellaceae bacterium]|nr:hypothetical protein [Coxiellaceae bacterium]
MAAFWQKVLEYYEGMVKREQVLAVVSVLFVITGLWYWLIWDVVEKNQIKYKAKISVMKREQQTLQDDILLQNARLAKDPNDEIKSKQKKLQSDFVKLNNDLQVYSTQLLSSQGLMGAIKDITVKASNIEITSIDILPDKEEEETKDTAHPLYRHGVQIKFIGDYFATMSYLEQMEILPWRLFWDKIIYKVGKYPNADVTLELHTLSEKPNEE